LVQAEFFEHSNPPESYESGTYFWINALKFIDSKNMKTLVTCPCRMQIHVNLH